jgi:NAD(P)-dependent dehydrogenase (short-subunit alcohol dehydrogenase family)
MASMTGKTVLVTGATNGIGEATARGLAAMGARVFVHGRNPAKGAAVVEAIKAATRNPAVEFVGADFGSLSEVRAMTQEMLRRAPKLDVLVNNAGRGQIKRTVTKDGFEAMFGVNHLAPFLLTNLLLGRIKENTPARVVVVASTAHWGPQLDFDDLNVERRFNIRRAYHRSKLANMLFARVLAKRLAGTGVTVNALHPGVVRTGIALEGAPAVLRVLGQTLIHPFLISPEEGAKTSIYLASAPEVASVTGGYFDKCKAAPQSAESQDDAAAEKLWAVSEKLVGLA